MRGSSWRACLGDETYGTTIGSDSVANWEFKYDIEGRLTQEELYGWDGGQTTDFGRRKVGFDAVGRRTKLWFYSENRSGHLNLNTNQTYSYDSSKHRLTQIQRESDSGQKAQYFYDDTDGRVTKVAYGTGARAEYGYDASGALTKIGHYANGGTLIGSVAYEYGLAGNVREGGANS